MNEYPFPSQKFNRNTVLSLLTNSIRVEATRFTRNLAEVWLDQYSGDIAVELMLAQALLKEEKIKTAVPVIKQIVFTDPEFLPAQRLLAYSNRLSAYRSMETAQQCILALGGRVPEAKGQQQWGKALKRAIESQAKGDARQAEDIFRKTAERVSDSPLPAVLHLRMTLSEDQPEASLKLAEQYTDRWPDTLPIILTYADLLNRSDNEALAISLMHHAVSIDVGGQVPLRIWGADHPYKGLWPQEPQIIFDQPIPAAVAAAQGWNQLPAGAIMPVAEAEAKTKAPSRSSKKSTREKSVSKKAALSAKKELEELAVKIQQPALGNADARYPTYIILSSKKGLEQQYGIDKLKTITQTVDLVEQSTQQLQGWNAYTLYVDDPQCTDKFDLPPALPNDPWSVKNLLHDLDKALARRGERIGAVLIVGNEKVIPFHLLPNPLDDFDNHVPSDNPYACPDENYFIPRWPVGRLPGSAGPDPQPLLNQMKKIITARETQVSTPSPAHWLIRLLQLLFGAGSNGAKAPNFGYTAEVWRRASHAVYRPIGKPHHLQVSPPTTANRIGKVTAPTTHLAYYNLHGLQDGPEWYGQKDPVEGQQGPEYPIALRPKDILNHGSAPKIVFSEACFGANVIDKEVDEAICLKFLDSGSHAVVGSTCTSYGSIKSPLIAADLLGKAFWNFIQDGFPVGEALRRAKINLAREMNARQGYLDGEDQKTLVSFVLYGDPLATSSSLEQLSNSKNFLQPSFNPAQIKTVCDKVNPLEAVDVPDEVIESIRGVVKHYLPGMEGAQMAVSHEHTQCQGHDCPTHFMEGKSNPKSAPTRKVVTLRKEIVRDEQTHAQHARITLNAEGKVTKLAVSR